MNFITKIIHSEVIKQFVKYSLVGLIGTFLQSMTLVLLVENYDFYPLVGSLIGFVFSLMFSFFINAIWTFRSAKKASYFYKYFIVSLFGLGINLFIMFLLVNVLDIWYIWAQLIIIIVVPCINFILNRYWAFT